MSKRTFGRFDCLSTNEAGGGRAEEGCGNERRAEEQTRPAPPAPAGAPLSRPSCWPDKITNGRCRRRDVDSGTGGVTCSAVS
ncbi:hypothetical protein EVAR_23010_1 [Eumeta japonica]|uniref:Uncharacterized protein n=1 Tax=Eumeta variegata TaxID=151549 RepID=A0A4C1UQ41_EUMVA|nr:hypothetical protein EVAR_23010_1 [Eumeta japonica]